MSASTRRIVFLVYPGFELLDMAGPMAVFTTANQLTSAPLYRVVVASARGGVLKCSAGLPLETAPCRGLDFRTGDTVLVMGAYAQSLRDGMRQSAIVNALRQAAPHVDRYGSVCSGTFLLGAAGLIGGRRVTTHWAAKGRLEDAFPDADVSSDALYEIDGRLWTSAGVSTGIDMALGMLAADQGGPIAARVARQLVLYSRRPGHQSQFSTVLEAQNADGGVFASLIDWIESNLGERICVEDMAAYVGMSSRTFYRKFTEAMRNTPARYLEARRLEWAKRFLEGGQPVKSVARKTGFASDSAFRTAFTASFGITPSHHARMHKGEPFLA